MSNYENLKRVSENAHSIRLQNFRAFELFVVQIVIILYSCPCCYHSGLASCVTAKRLNLKRKFSGSNELANFKSLASVRKLDVLTKSHAL